MLKVAIVAACVGLAGLETARGQQPSPAERALTGEGRAPAPARAANPGPMISIEFPGGNLKGFVQAMREAAGAGKVNVLLPKDAEDVPVPPVTLKDVSPLIALKSVVAVLGGEWINRVAVQRMGEADDAVPTLVVMFSGRNLGGMAAAPSRTTQVFSIRDLVEPPAGAETDPHAAVTAETVLSAIKALAELDERTHVEPAEVMLHPESKLLIVRGTQEQLNSIQSVMNQLGRGMQGSRQQAEEAARREREMKMAQIEMETQLKMSAQQMAGAENRVAMTTEQLKRAEQAAAAGGMSKPELENMQAELAAARNQLEQARIARQAAEERAAVMKAKAAAGGDVGEGSVPAAYDITDLKQFHDDVVKAVALVARLQGGGVRRFEPDTIIVDAPARAHQSIVQFLNTVRRVRANEPKLPGLNAEDLIRKGLEDNK